MLSRKLLLGFFTSFLLVVNISSAQVVTVEGIGESKNEAMRDAMRNAVEKVVGTFIDSRTLVSESVVAMDEIYAKSQGFVRDVKILDEAKSVNGYYIKANIDVDTNRNSKLYNEIAMIMALNDPRIFVNISFHRTYDGNDQKEKYPIICEAEMNNKLIDLGFKHVIVTNKLKPDYEGDDFYSKQADYIVLGKLDIISSEISLPKYENYTNQTSYNANLRTGLIKASAELDAEIVKVETSEVIGHIRSESVSIKDSVNSSENYVVKEVGQKAAEDMRKIFARKAADVSSNLQVIVRTGTYNNLMKLDKALKNISGVHNTIIRVYDNEKGIIDVDSDLKPQMIFKLLKQNNEINVFLEKFSTDSVELSI